MEDPQNREPWHVKREVNIAHMLTTIGLAATAIIYLGSVVERVSLLEQNQQAQVAAQRERDESQNAQIRQQSESIAKTTDRIEAKITSLERLLIEFLQRPRGGR
jgi:hypothetical protein